MESELFQNWGRQATLPAEKGEKAGFPCAISVEMKHNMRVANSQTLLQIAIARKMSFSRLNGLRIVLKH